MARILAIVHDPSLFVGAKPSEVMLVSVTDFFAQERWEVNGIKSVIREQFPSRPVYEKLVEDVGGLTKVRPAFNPTDAATIISSEMKRLGCKGSVSVRQQNIEIPTANQSELSWLKNMENAGIFVKVGVKVTRSEGSLEALPEMSKDDVFFDSDGALFVRLNKVAVFSDQPRGYFDPVGMDEMAASMQAVGQLIPVFVRPLADQSKYYFQLIDGERRYRTCQRLGISHIQVTVRTVQSAAEHFKLSAVANFCRADHPPLEVARALKQIQEDEQCNLAELGQMFGKSDQWAYQYLALLRLHADVQALMDPRIPEKKRLSKRVALLLVALTPAKQCELAKKIVTESLRYSEAASLVTEASGGVGETKARRKEPRHQQARLKGFFERTRKELGVHKRLPLAEYQRVFEARSAEEYEGFLDDIAGLITDLQQFQKLLVNAAPRSA